MPRFTIPLPGLVPGTAVPGQRGAPGRRKSARRACDQALVIVAVWAFVLAGCATTPADKPLRGSSGPVAWEVIDLQERDSSDGQTTRWDYALVFKETEGRTVQFEKELHSAAGGGRRRIGTGGREGVPRERPFKRRLNPHSEFRVSRAATLRVRSTFASLIVLWRYEATDDAVRRLIIDIRLPLARGAGRRTTDVETAGPLPPARPLETSELAALAGQWRGYYRDDQGFRTLVTLDLKKDGSFEAAMVEPVKARFQGTLSIRDGRVLYSAEDDMGGGSDTGTLTLHEGLGKRVLIGNISAQRESANVVHRYDLDPSLGVFIRQAGPTSTVGYTVRLEAQP